MRTIIDAIHSVDDELLLSMFHTTAERSVDDEFIQLMLKEIQSRNLTLAEVIGGDELH